VNILESSTGRGFVDFDVKAGHLIAVAIEKDDIRGPFVDGDDVSASRRAHDRVSDFRFSDQHILNFARKIDDDRSADAEPNDARSDFAGYHGYALGRRIAFRAARRLGHARHRAEQQQSENRRQPHRSPCSHYQFPLNASWFAC
jgi:hypothetical protein